MVKHALSPACRTCKDALGFEVRMALQPIVDVARRAVFAYEALVRGADGAPAGEVLARVDDDNRYRFDQACRIAAVELAGRLALPTPVSINFLPNAIYEPARCIRTTVAAAERAGVPLERIILELTEAERIDDVPHLRAIVTHYRERGFRTAIDDFGAGYSGLNLLAELQPDYIKLDMALVRAIDRSRPRRAIVKGILQVCTDLAITPIAEGIETRAELAALVDLGVQLFQGYYFARPALEATPAVTFA